MLRWRSSTSRLSLKMRWLGSKPRGRTGLNTSSSISAMSLSSPSTTGRVVVDHVIDHGVQHRHRAEGQPLRICLELLAHVAEAAASTVADRHHVVGADEQLDLCEGDRSAASSYWAGLSTTNRSPSYTSSLGRWCAAMASSTASSCRPSSSRTASNSAMVGS